MLSIIIGPKGSFTVYDTVISFVNSQVLHKKNNSLVEYSRKYILVLTKYVNLHWPVIYLRLSLIAYEQKTLLI